eukprot:499062-Alexandrium_andersonii.AAC.1
MDKGSPSKISRGGDKGYGKGCARAITAAFSSSPSVLTPRVSLFLVPSDPVPLDSLCRLSSSLPFALRV